MRASTEYQTTQSMRNRLARDPHDAEAKAFFERTERLSTIDEQYRHAMEEYPETFGRVLMLYIAASIHGTPIQAFCDSGAQMTIMSHRLAVACGIADLIDTRLAGVAVGVGTGVLLGRIHTVQLQIGESHFFPCSVTVMEDPPPGSKAKEMPFLLGLDMMKRHTCLLDLERGCLRFRLGSRSDTNSIDDNYLEAPFLHEKDLTEEQGGTKGFDADKANQELLAAQQQHAAARGNEPSDDADDDAMKDS